MPSAPSKRSRAEREVPYDVGHSAFVWFISTADPDDFTFPSQLDSGDMALSLSDGSAWIYDGDDWLQLAPESGGSGGHTIREDGVDLTQRTGLNFIGTGITASDDAGGDETEIALNYATTSEIADIAATEGAGSSGLIARGDHVHAHGTGYLPNAHHTSFVEADHTAIGNAAPHHAAESGQSSTHTHATHDDAHAHADLSGVSADQHHTGFIGLEDNAGTAVSPDTDDRIQFTDDGVINVDASGNTLDFSIAQDQIDHGALDGLTDDDHTQYALLAGRSGGQTLIGGTGTGENLVLQSNTSGDGGVQVSDGTDDQLTLAPEGKAAIVFSEFSWDPSDPIAYGVGLSTLSSYGLVVASAGNVTVNLDSNNNGSFSLFQIISNDYLVPNQLLSISENDGQLKLPTTGSGAGLLIGGDAQLYRSAADVLRTPDSLIVDTNLTVSTLFNLPATAYAVFTERTAPTGDPDANTGWLYSKDVSGQTHPFWQQEDGTEFDLTADTGVAAHNILDGGTAHLDAASASVAQGALIYGDSTPEWNLLDVAGGGAGAVVGTDGTDVTVTIPDRTITLTAGGGMPTTTAGCSSPTQVEAGTNDVDYWVLDFDTSSDEFAFWGPFALPDNYDGGDFSAVFYWTAAGGSAAQTVAWGIQILTLANDDPIDTAWGTADVQSDTWIANGDIHKSAELTGVTPTGNGGAGDICIVRVHRDVSADDLSGDARLLSVKLTYTTNAVSD